MSQKKPKVFVYFLFFLLHINDNIAKGIIFLSSGYKLFIFDELMSETKFIAG